ncbi:hypothetical protein BIY24_16130 [Halobacteriovorax marinus]|uniref:hypothetical protein n=1 Tax=Halobacteriovorax marinus TaxID=97084 RepID=UPI000BC32ED0|nr:hypothetical protein [Halobacteriovorax marinus]ATH09412.1 hypothetical protein BIY24_16130 [Halobacteriovorax marinus]
MLRKKLINLSKVATLATLTMNSAHALPIDWHGVFGVDTTLINNYRRVKNTTDNKPIANNAGSQEIGLGTGNEKASFQSYIFRLNPHIIVNDSASFKAELTSGYGRGGRLGDDRTTDATNDNFGNALYVQNKSSSSKSLVINQAYMELYSDTATYVIGRHTSDWGLGAVYNSGSDTWDRHAFSRDGITAKIKIGNFLIEPYWAKIDSEASLSRNTKANEIGAGLLYDNVDRDIAFGLLYAKKNNKSGNTRADTNTTGAASAYSLGETDVKVTDIYFKKIFGNFKLELEVPIISGELGKVYNTGTTKVNSKSFIFETEYKLNDSWTLAFDFGSISGHSGSTTSYEAMYLNPNYQVANLLFRYNLQAVGNTNYNIYDSYMTNATYAKIAGEYKSDKWSWVAAMIWAKANETAKAGQSSYNHTNNKTFTAADTQADDLGMEIDLNFDYHWNNAVKVGGSLGYLFAGDYFAFTNDPTSKNTADNSFALQLNSSIEF